MGVYQIRNLRSNRILVGSTLNLDAMFNRHEFQLRLGKHPNASLQRDWLEHGRDSFVFEVLDELEPREGVTWDYRADLASLEEIWLEKLNPYDGAGYNERKKDRDELLRDMMTRRTEAG
ncbi:MAG: GIY-YIG nuclease family protein [Acidobacteriota bacterium]